MAASQPQQPTQAKAAAAQPQLSVLPVGSAAVAGATAAFNNATAATMAQMLAASQNTSLSQPLSAEVTQMLQAQLAQQASGALPQPSVPAAVAAAAAVAGASTSQLQQQAQQQLLQAQLQQTTQTASLVSASAAVAGGATATPMQVAGQTQPVLQQPVPAQQTAPGTLPQQPQPISAIQLPNQQGAGTTPQPLPQTPQAGVAAAGAPGTMGLPPQIPIGQQAPGAQAVAAGQPQPGVQNAQLPASQPAGQPVQGGIPGQQPGAAQPGQLDPQQQQRSAPPAWYIEEDHKETRKKMWSSIAHLLQARKPTAPEEWRRKLPQMARRLEESLFRGAATFDEYRDTATLKARLQNLAKTMGIRANGRESQAAPGAKQQAPSHGASGQQGANGAGYSGGSAKGGSQNNDQRQQVLRQQQQRLLLLRHASKCKHENGKCPVTQHCAGMKRLWKHIAECKDQLCQVPHCVSSRYVLSHYHRCKEAGCAVCGPVREAIHRNHEKLRQLNAAQQPGRPGPGRAPPSPSNQQPKKRGSGKEAPGNPNKKMKQQFPNSKQPKQPPPMQMIPVPHRPTGQGTWDPTTSMINMFTTSQIRDHINSLEKQLSLKPAMIRNKCQPVLKRLMESEFGWIFNKPVNPVDLNLPDYFEVIKQPMDLGTVMKNLTSQFYRNVDEFTNDVRLTFDNAIQYNGQASEVTAVARDMKKRFDTDFKKVLQDLTKEEEQKKRNGDACSLCGNEKINFEPTSYYCNGAACQGQRIRRNSYFFTAGQNKYHWCHVCHQDLQDDQPIEMADMTFRKKELVKKKNDEMNEEPWVQCDLCSRWVHQICALFNSRKNQGHNTLYHCPFCIEEQRKKEKKEEPPPTQKKIKTARLIAQTKFSKFIEDRVKSKLEKEYEAAAEAKGCTVDEVEKAGSIFIRQLSNLKDKVHTVRGRVLDRYKDQGFPDSFPVTSKCIVLFEEIDGVDVILFGLYLYEYGHTAPQPNHRRAYVSYLDSVHYFRPRQYRTAVYHEMLVAYLDYIKNRGFHTCHIWACPPCKGDDYIFFCHPEEQKTPKEDRLRNWYISMLEKSKEEGVVIHLTNLFDEHFKAPDSKAIDVPYFEGDYWLSEAEAILKALEDEKEQRSDGKATKKAKKDKTKKAKASGRGLRSDGDVEELNGRDPLVVRMGKTLEPMKDAFIVAYLQPRSFAKETWERRLKEIEDEKNAPQPKASAAAEDTSAPPDDVGTISSGTKVGERSKSSGSSDGKAEGAEEASASDKMDVEPKPEDDGEKDGESKMDVEGKDKDGEEKASEDGASGSKAEDGAKDDVKVKTEESTDKMDVDKSAEGKEASSSDGASSSSAAASSSADKVAEEKKAEETKAPKDETEDPDDQLENDFFDSRQQFLNLCQGNHYQFDTLRRAKHTSMMSLYHIHNPTMPKFIVPCSNCTQEIISGFKYDCAVCSDFHLCHDCFQHMGNRHPHRLKKTAVQSEGSTTQLTDEQRRQRQRSIQLHMQLLQHASACTNKSCPSANCEKMKNLLSHGPTCKIKVQGGCNICRRIYALLQIHARQCRREQCPVPKCRQLKEQLRNIQAQQDAMNERRRIAMNQQYTRPAGKQA